jgi:hypothetical protein
LAQLPLKYSRKQPVASLAGSNQASQQDRRVSRCQGIFAHSSAPFTRLRSVGKTGEGEGLMRRKSRFSRGKHGQEKVPLVGIALRTVGVGVFFRGFRRTQTAPAG